MRNSLRLALACALLASAPALCQAGVVFTFTESGGDVLMTSSGSVDVRNLVSVDLSGWGSTGIEENGNYDIMGGTDVGAIELSFGFHDGTDYSQWATAVGPWSSSNFTAVPTGTKGFTTYHWNADTTVQLPGLGVERADLVGGIWTPDQSWTFSSASFASLNMHTGTYTVADAVTGESITYVIGATAVPLPSSALMGLGLLGAVGVAMGLRRRTPSSPA